MRKIGCWAVLLTLLISTAALSASMEPKAGSIPESVVLALIGFGLVGLAGYVKKANL